MFRVTRSTHGKNPRLKKFYDEASLVKIGCFRADVFFLLLLFLSPPVQIAQWAHMHHFLSVCSLDLTKKGENA